MSLTTRAAVCPEPGGPWEITELELHDRGPTRSASRS